MICIWHLLMATYAQYKCPRFVGPPSLFSVDTRLMRNTTVSQVSRVSKVPEGGVSWCRTAATCSSLCRRHVNGQLAGEHYADVHTSWTCGADTPREIEMVSHINAAYFAAFRTAATTC